MDAKDFAAHGRSTTSTRCCEQSRAQPLVMGLALHPYIVGQPYRLRHLRTALQHLARARDRGEIWFTTPGAIAGVTCAARCAAAWPEQRLVRIRTAPRPAGRIAAPSRPASRPRAPTHAPPRTRPPSAERGDDIERASTARCSRA